MSRCSPRHRLHQGRLKTTEAYDVIVDLAELGSVPIAKARYKKRIAFYWFWVVCPICFKSHAGSTRKKSSAGPVRASRRSCVPSSVGREGRVQTGHQSALPPADQIVEPTGMWNHGHKKGKRHHNSNHD